MDGLRYKVRWALIGWMFVISAIAYLDRVNISIAAHSIQEEFKLSNIELGWVFSAFVAGYALFQTPGGKLADKFGPRLILGLGTVWWAVFTTITAMVPSGMAKALAVLLAVRFALGLGEAVVYPASNRLVASWIPSEERGLANGIIFAGVGAGAGVSPPLITYILLHWGWHWSFYISALIGLAAGVVWWLLVRDRPEDHPLMTKEEARHIETGLPAARTRPQGGSSIRWGQVALVTLSYTTFGYVAYIFFTWFFLYLSQVRHLDLKSSSYYGMLPFIAMAVGSPLGGLCSDWLTKKFGKRIGRCGFASGAMALAAFFMAISTNVTDARVATLVLAGGAGALYLSASSFWSMTADLGGRSAGTVSGVMNTGNQAAGATTAVVTPWIAMHFGWTQSFLAAAGLCLLGAVAWLLVRPESKATE
jgi:ACS family glucarate transporter-like MFS transporter